MATEIPASIPRRAAGPGPRSTIVVGLDGSDSSWDALSWACGEAERLDGRVIAAFVSGLVDTNLGLAAAAGVDTGQQLEALNEVARDRATDLAQAVAARQRELGLDIRFVHAEGDTSAELLRIAQQVKADVLAVGRSCKLRHHLAGSVGRRLATSKNAPIVVVVP